MATSINPFLLKSNKSKKCFLLEILVKEIRRQQTFLKISYASNSLFFFIELEHTITQAKAAAAQPTAAPCRLCK